MTHHENTLTLLRIIQQSAGAGVKAVALMAQAGQSDKTVRRYVQPLLTSAPPLVRKYKSIETGTPSVYVCATYAEDYEAAQSEAAQIQADQAAARNAASKRAYTDQLNAIRRVKTQRNTTVRPERLRCEAIIAALQPGETISVAEVANAAEIDIETARQIMQHLRTDSLAVNINAGSHAKPAMWAKPKDRAATAAAASTIRPARVCNSSTSGVYSGHDLRDFDGRAGAMQAYRDLPSRVNNALHYPCGRVEAFPEMRAVQP